MSSKNTKRPAATPNSHSSPMKRRSKVSAESSACAEGRHSAGEDAPPHGDAVSQTPTDIHEEGLAIQIESYKGKGKGKQRAIDLEMSFSEQNPASKPAIPDDRTFPLMSLPAEIRNEIYRACLTRPFNVLLSKQEPPSPDPAAPLVTPTETQDLNGAAPVNGARLTGILQDLRQDRPAPHPRAGRHHAYLTRADPPQREDDLIETSRRSSRQDTTLHPGALMASLAAFSANMDSVAQPSGSQTNAALPQSALPQAALPQATLPQATLPQISEDSSQQPDGSSTQTQPENRVRRPQAEDPLVPNILLLNKQVYEEARSILYGENRFTLDIYTATSSLAALHQRSRRQIKHVELEIPSYNEILERFQEAVRLSLRYCWGLRTFVIHMPFTLPGAEGGSANSSTVYANGFDILRWLPRQCEVVLEGKICPEISAVVSKNANLAKSLDELAYARRQLIANEHLRSMPPKPSKPSKP